MQILSARLLRIEIIKPIKFSGIKQVEADWDVRPVFTIGNGSIPNTTLQYVDIEIIRQKSIRQATLTVRTVFEINLGNKDIKPETEQDFQAYTDFIQISAAHARALFQREVRGSIFGNDILPFEFSTHATIKLKAGLSINNN
ncbi:MAG TPA: hypothetical protein VLM16_02975 [Ginsengibacter sp.]|nr:hypothetical protein [Ginsengibacter sp.]